MAKTLNVAMNGVLTGQLSKLPGGGLSFSYDPNWLTSPKARPISLSLPLGSKPINDDKIYHFFDNLLPDNDKVRERIQRRFNAKTKRPFDLLEQIGNDCIGALQLYPQDLPYAPVNQVTADPLTTEQVEMILLGHQSGAPLGMLNTQDDFRISIAGAQEKTGLLWYDNQWCRPRGTTPTSHILKLPIGDLPHHNIDLTHSVENEWLCLKLFEGFGMDVCKAEMQQFDDTKVLVVERFDRRWAKDKSWLVRLPQEDACQALGVPPARKYQADGGPGMVDIMKLLLGSQQPHQDRVAFFKAQVLFYLLAAIDGHGKNFSLYLEKGGGFRMTPLYDIMSAYPHIHANFPRQKLKMAMSWEGKSRHYHWAGIHLRNIFSTAKKVGLGKPIIEAILSEIEQQVAPAIAYAEAQLPTGFPAHVSETILNGFQNSLTHLFR